MRRMAGVALLLACIGGSVAAQDQDSVACKGPGAPMRFRASGLSPWHTLAGGVARMDLVGGPHPAATQIVVYRERYPATYLADSSKATVQRNVGTAYILVLHGTLVVDRDSVVDFANASAYGPRSFLVIPAAAPFRVWSRGPVEIQVETMGPPHPGPVPRQDAGAWIALPTFPAAPAASAPAESPPAPANGLTPWQSTRAGGRMRLMESTPASPTELTAARFYWLPPVMQDSAKLTYHFHYGTELITILCGTVAYGEGNHVDYSKSHDYGPGSFIENPAGNPHFEWFKGPLEAEVDFIGSSGAMPLDPATGKPKR